MEHPLLPWPGTILAKISRNCNFLLRSFSGVNLGLLFVISISQFPPPPPPHTQIQAHRMNKKEIYIFYFFLAKCTLKYKMTSQNFIVITSSNICCFLFEFLTWYDTIKFHVNWPSHREVTKSAPPPLPPAMPDSEKPGLFRVIYGHGINKRNE